MTKDLLLLKRMSLKTAQTDGNILEDLREKISTRLYPVGMYICTGPIQC